ncbi:MAG: oligosaccharide flippase family protein, partial [Clostridia bacterium]|nr:oligosaccharide flippase family protein [Clostridia bacterium]
MTEQTRRFFKNALALAGAAVLMRTVGVTYNATLSAHIGAEGMGLFSLISSLQGFAITFATSGVSLAVTRLVSECMGSGEPAS